MQDKKEEEKKERVEMEFGGTIGAVLIIMLSHFLLYYLYLSLWLYQGSLFAPWKNIDIHLTYIRTKMAPTMEICLVYLAFIALQTVFAWILPGFMVQGLPVPSLNGRQLWYNCNGYSSWWLSKVVMVVLHFSSVFPITWISRNIGGLITTVVIFSDIVAVCVYIVSLHLKIDVRMTGSHIYDFFMGASLNPRLGSLDIKMWAETRVSWITLFLLTVSAAVDQYEQLGHVTTPMMFMVTSHWLYTNACAKGEEMIPVSWDIFHEKWGWMLCFWNLAGVPVMYCWNTYYLLQNPYDVSTPTAIIMFTLLLAQYYIWDTANSHKCSFRMQQRGLYRERPWYIFPKLPWKYVENPKTITTDDGHTILVDGWYKYARKLHYTMDVLLALMWGLACGTTHFLPYWYFVFFTLFIVDRWKRDDKRCAAKYGEAWKRYKTEVPYVFIPYVI